MYFTGNDVYQNFLVFVSMLSSIMLDSGKKVTDWISTGISSENIKLFDTNFEIIMYNLSNGRLELKFSNSVLVIKVFSSLYNNFILRL